jgi:hypothetical protein
VITAGSKLAVAITIDGSLRYDLLLLDLLRIIARSCLTFRNL